MRILIAPDAFKGTLSAVEAAEAIAAGWPEAELVLRPLSDGGPGFSGAIARARAARVQTSRVRSAFGDDVEASWCEVDGTAYLEVAQCVGIAFGTDVMRASSYGVGQLITAACAAGVHRIVLGLGGTNVNDGGAGMFAALGATAVDAAGAAVRLDEGPRALVDIDAVDLRPALATLRGIQLVAATDVDVPLLGPRGATYGFGPQKGAIDPQLVVLESALQRLAVACGRRDDGKDAAVALGAGAAGGLGFALIRLGAQRVPGIDTVWDESAIELDGIDLIVTGEGRLDWQSQRGKVVSGVARRGMERGIPVIALCGDVDMARRERMELGLAAAYSMVEFAGEELAMAAPAATLADLAARVARTWR